MTELKVKEAYQSMIDMAQWAESRFAGGYCNEGFLFHVLSSARASGRLLHGRLIEKSIRVRRGKVTADAVFVAAEMLQYLENEIDRITQECNGKEQEMV